MLHDEMSMMSSRRCPFEPQRKAGRMKDTNASQTLAYVCFYQQDENETFFSYSEHAEYFSVLCKNWCERSNGTSASLLKSGIEGKDWGFRICVSM